MPESGRANLRDGLAAVPVPTRRVTTVIAWPPHSVSSGVAGLVRTASRLYGAPHDRPTAAGTERGPGT